MPRRRLAFLVLLALLLLAGVLAVRSLGAILHHEDALDRADVIFVLSGERVERIAEAGELFLQGWAPAILLSRQRADAAEIALRARGIRLPTEIEFQRDVLVQMGVSATAIDALSDAQTATANEAVTLRRFAAVKGWKTIIVVTSKLHTARARLTMVRQLEDDGRRIIMRGSRYDEANIDRWWSNRSDLRFVLFESQKLLAYWLGIAD